MTDLLVAFGSNLGARRVQLLRALKGLCGRPGLELTARSRIFETKPVGGPPQGPYLNACARFRTTLGPREVLGALQDEEALAGRERKGVNHPRTLDLDLLLFGEQVVAEEGLLVPHPRLHQRAFVLLPAVEVAGEMRHPLLGLSLRACLERLETVQGVRALAGAWT